MARSKTTKNRNPDPLPVPTRGPRGRSRGLASPRDRRRLRERTAAERARVERVLATAPMPVEPEAAPTRRFGLGFSAFSLPDRVRHAREAMGSGVPSPTRCGVCDGTELSVDEVAHGGPLRLIACRRCDHLWTERWTECSDTWSTSARKARSVSKRRATDRDLLLDLPF